MPRINQRKYHSHKVKRLHRHDGYTINHHFPSHILDENFLDKTTQYIKYFDYPLPHLLVDHSTNPLQNTTRQYIDQSLNNSIEGRFKNHEMIIRRNGETIILRPKQDVVLANGFTPVIRPSSTLPFYQSLITYSQVPSSLSIMNKMSTKKSEERTIIKPKRKDRHRRKRCDEKSHSTQSNFIHLFKQALHDMIEEQEYLPPPLMSILPQFHHSNNQPSYVHKQPSPPLLPNNKYQESFYDFPLEQYRSFKQSHSPPQQEHICSHRSISNQRHYPPMSNYFFN